MNPMIQEFVRIDPTTVNLDASEPGEVIYEGPGLIVRVPDPDHPSEHLERWAIIDRRGAVCLRCPEFSVAGYPVDLDDLLDHQVRAHGYVRVHARKSKPPTVTPKEHP